MKILIIGGSGFVSGTLARMAVEQGHKVWSMTRGQRSLPDGVTGLIADRHDEPAMSEAVSKADTTWDLVVDCIGFTAADAEQDIALFRERAHHLVFASTDFVYDPARRTLPQGEETEHYLTEGYGGNKRLAELALINGDTGDMTWSIVRPCHIYGPGSRLGCLPLHGRDPELINRLKAGEPLTLVGGGYFLQQSILASDLSKLILSMVSVEATFGQVFCTTGPNTIQSRDFYQIIADILGVRLTINETPVDAHLAENPGAATFLCHRRYDMSKLRATDVAVPDTPIEVGLQAHIESLI
jgi:nucleoside-diphosphate-sugar epimerase